ncbi:hypothetical protein ASG44_06980 [Methylophilus sp. Leaf459]|nr:hypothetical protein ASG34_07005 [Methylophilus sp. Leaf416]KQT56668.1 hypothetical protein ASG44_06980 [Methylophilus sp. Leaf459]
MNWKVGIFVLALLIVISVCLWGFRTDVGKGKLKFALYTLTSCIAYPFGVLSLSSILVSWVHAKEIIGTANCSLSAFPLCFFAHTGIFTAFIFLFFSCSILAWSDALNRRLEPTKSNNPISQIYRSSWLIERSWNVLPFLMLALIAIWAGVI